MTGDSGELLEDLPIPDAAPLRRRFCCRCGFMRRAGGGRQRACAGAAVRGARCLSLAVWWRAGQPPTLSDFRVGQGAYSGRVADGQRGESAGLWRGNTQTCGAGWDARAPGRHRSDARRGCSIPGAGAPAGRGARREVHDDPKATSRRRQAARAAHCSGAGPTAEAGRDQAGARETGRHGAGLHHRCPGPGDEDGRRRLSSGVQRAAGQRHGQPGDRGRGRLRQRQRPRADGADGPPDRTALCAPPAGLG